MLADLHTHTTASDGQYTPTQLIEKAGKYGLTCLAITDHDTIAGLSEAERAGKQMGIRVVNGVELGAKEYRNLHILGYAFDPNSPVLLGLCHKLKDGRDERKYRIVDFLKEKGIQIDLAEVEEIAGGEIIARPHFAQVLVRRGYVSNVREAFDRYLDTEEYQRIERFRADARTCMETIRQAGGKACFAHPYQVKLPDDQLESLVRQLKEYGLEGIECYYPRHTPEQTTFYLELAKKYQLHVTGGSDFHGERVKPDIALAKLELELDWLMTSL